MSLLILSSSLYLDVLNLLAAVTTKTFNEQRYPFELRLYSTNVLDLNIVVMLRAPYTLRTSLLR